MSARRATPLPMHILAGSPALFIDHPQSVGLHRSVLKSFLIFLACNNVCAFAFFFPRVSRGWLSTFLITYILHYCMVRPHNTTPQEFHPTGYLGTYRQLQRAIFVSSGSPCLLFFLIKFASSARLCRACENYLGSTRNTSLLNRYPLVGPHNQG